MTVLSKSNKNQNYTNAQMVRVPRNLINIQTNFESPKYDNLKFVLNSKWSDTAGIMEMEIGPIEMK